MPNYNQAPLLKSNGEKNRDNKWGKAIRTNHLESLIFNGIDGKSGAQLKIMFFLTGNADNGSFAVAEKTIMDRCGISETTYKKARKSLVEKGWLIHNVGKNNQQGEIIVDYDAIYKSEKKDTEDTPSLTTENTPSISEDTPKGHIEETHNNISDVINKNTEKPNITRESKPKEAFTEFVF